MFYKMLLAVVAVAVVLPPAYSTSLHDVPKESTPALNAIKEEFVQKHPDLVHWIERAVSRVKENKTASTADLMEVQESLENVRDRIYEFVTSPIFFVTTDIFIGKAIRVVSPMLGVLPIKELRELFEIVKKDPSLSQQDITDLVPEAHELDNWLVNSTSHIFAETMGSVVPKTNVSVA